MTKFDFFMQLKNVLKIRKKLTRNDLVSVLNVFWKNVKDRIDPEYQVYCHTILKNVLKTFDTIILESRFKYYYCHGKKMVEVVERLEKTM